MNNRRRMRARGRGPRFTRRELWNLDHTLARVIAAGLRQFIAADRHGYGAETPEAWEGILHELLWTFDELAQDRPHDPHSMWFTREHARLAADPRWRFCETVPLDDGGHLVTKLNFPETPPEVQAASSTYEQRLANGLRLFAEHLRGLWD